MSSKKASFESKDPSHAASNVTSTPKVDDGIPFQKSSFQSKDPSFSADLTLDVLEETPGSISEKVSFYARDPDLGTTNVSKKAKKKYMGVEHRRGNRRKARDRRSDVRFDLNKSDRREDEGRREDDASIKYW